MSERKTEVQDIDQAWELAEGPLMRGEPLRAWFS